MTEAISASLSISVPQTTELAYKLRGHGIRVPLDLFDPETCAKAVAEALTDRSGKKKKAVNR